MLNEPVVKSMSTQRLAVDLAAVVVVLVCILDNCTALAGLKGI
jgi:hypothetical protein